MNNPSGIPVVVLGVILAAVGAVLRYAVSVTVSSSVNFHVIGLILLVVGIVAFVIGTTLTIIGIVQGSPKRRPPER